MKCITIIGTVLLIVQGTMVVADSWVIIPGEGNSNDEAYTIAVADLQDACGKVGIELNQGNTTSAATGNCILVGNADRNATVAEMLRNSDIELQHIQNSQGFEMITAHQPDGTKALIIAGGGIEGDIFGLYWLWDRIRVFKTIPELNLVRIPALTIRAGGGGNAVSLKHGLRYTINWAIGADGNSLVPWESEPLHSANAQNREEVQKIINTAHELHIKYFVYTDEFSYHPEELKRFKATLTPESPKLWEMLQDKYRRLFTAMPDIDGVCIRTGELTRVSEPLLPYNVMHEPASVPEWPLEKRYRTFLQTMHQVVVDEFGKLYFHRTWVTNTTEQHSDPEVYRAIFKEDVPTNNLYLSPYLTKGDRWFYQPINPTFNLTPHKMLALLASMNYHEQGGVNIFPTYPGLYFQEGFNRLWPDPNCNIAGAHFWSEDTDGWWSNELTAYTAFRMAWNPLEDPRVIAEDFAAIHFGRAAAQSLGEAIMLSGEAYKHGLYVKPVAESISGNTLPQLRLTTFPVKGFPALDQGKGHIDWLRNAIYLPSKSAIPEAIAQLDHGLALAERMVALGKQAQSDVDDPELAVKVLDSLNLAYLLILTNNAYIKTCYAYFEYYDDPTDEYKEHLKNEYEKLCNAIEAFKEAPGFIYKLFGIEQLRHNAEALLENRELAIKNLENAPDALETDNIIRERQKKDREMMDNYQDEATKILHWKGRVDGKDMLHIHGDQATIEHIAADHIQDDQATFFAPLPERKVTVFLKDITSPDMHPFVLEQPSKENDYTAKIYLFDLPPSYGQWEFEMYFVEAIKESL